MDLKNLDVSNKEKLEDYSNFSLKDLGNNISNAFQNTVQTVQNAGSNVVSSTQAAINNANDKAKEAAQKAKEAAQKAADTARAAAEKARAAAQKAAEDAKKAAENAKANAQKAIDNAKATAQKAAENAKLIAQKAADAAKKAAEDTKKGLTNLGNSIKKNLKDLSDKAKAAFQKLIAKQSLAGLYLLIRANNLGIATKLYPAIASDAEIKNANFKPTFVTKAKSAYAEIASKWVANGGKEDKLRDAITKGAKLRFGKKSSFNGLDNNGSSDGLITTYIDSFIYNNLTGSKVINSSFNGLDNAGLNDGIMQINYVNGRLYSGFDGINNYDATDYQAVVDYYSGCNGKKYSNVGGYDEYDSRYEESVYTDTDTYPVESVSTIPEPTPEESQALVEETGSTTVDEGQKATAIQKFIAWIMSVFKKNKMDETPYVEGTPEAYGYIEDVALTAEELLAAQNNAVTYGDDGAIITGEYDLPATTLKSSSDDKILGIPKVGFWIGVSVIGAGAIAGIIYLATRKR